MKIYAGTPSSSPNRNSRARRCWQTMSYNRRAGSGAFITPCCPKRTTGSPRIGLAKTCTWMILKKNPMTRLQRVWMNSISTLTKCSNQTWGLYVPKKCLTGRYRREWMLRSSLSSKHRCNSCSNSLKSPSRMHKRIKKLDSSTILSSVIHRRSKKASSSRMTIIQLAKSVYLSMKKITSSSSSLIKTFRKSENYRRKEKLTISGSLIWNVKPNLQCWSSGRQS